MTGPRRVAAAQRRPGGPAVTVLVGRRPGGPDDDGTVALGVRLARALGVRLLLCTVVPPGREDHPPTDAPPADGVAVEVTHVVDRSVPGGLARAAYAHQADLVVLGDGPHRLGWVGARLARAAELPVALAGTAPPGDGPITRVTCAFDAGRGAATVLGTAARLARRAGAAVRVASFAPQRPPTVPPEAGLDAERAVVEQWRTQVLAAQREALDAVDHPDPVETLAVAEPSVEDAVAVIGWDRGDLLVLGASALTAATRVLLGDPGAAILRAAPVPVVLAPGAPTL